MTPRRLRALADHLESRACSPSLDGYGLADGLRAAADLIDEKPGPLVHGDIEMDDRRVLDDLPRHALSDLEAGLANNAAR